MVPETKSCKKVALDVEVAPKVGFHKEKRITPKDHRTNHAWVVAYEGELGIRFERASLAESQGCTVPQTHRDTAIEAAEQPL